MMKKAGVLLLTVFLLFAATACAKDVYKGVRKAEESRFYLNYSMFTGTDSHTLELKQGDVLKADLVAADGTLKVVVQKEGSAPVFEQEEVSTGYEEITIPEDGAYQITVTGKRAMGSVSFTK